MDCEAETAEKESTTPRRPLLLRIETGPGGSELHDHCQRIAEAGFDGMELALSPGAGEDEIPWTEDELSAVAAARPRSLR